MRKKFAVPAKGQILAALCTMLITLGIMAFIYSLEYSIDARDRAKLEQEVGDYFFTEEMEARVLAQEKSGRKLYLLIERVGAQGIYGLAELERGILGRYRIAKADLSNWPLYQSELVQRGKGNQLLIYGLYTLPGVDRYCWYGSAHSGAEPGFVGAAETGPFLRLVDLPEELVLEPLWPGEAFRYLDAQGNVLDVETLEAQLPSPADVSCPSVGSEGAGVLALLLVPVFLAGLGIAGALLFGKKREITQDSE